MRYRSLVTGCLFALLASGGCNARVLVSTTASSAGNGGAGGTGGQAAGGQSTGGQATGGQATGGSSTGGQATGGQATGGQGAGLPGGVHGLTGTDFNAPTDDLQAFGDLVTFTPLVGLGESVHTSGGFLDLKVRLIKYLIEKKGFRVLAMETPHTQAELTGFYVATCEGTAEQALKGIFGVFASTGTRDLAEWMCKWNQENPDDLVQFVGFDAQQPWDDIAYLTDFLDKAVPDDAPGLLAGIAKCDGQGYASANDYYSSGAFDVAYSEGDFKDCTAGVDAIQAYLQDFEPTLDSAKTSLQRAKIAAIGLGSWQGEKFYFKTDYGKASESRDIAMAAILERTRDLLFKKKQAVVWAHNYHLTQNHPAVDDPGFGHTITMGSILAQDFGDEYKAFGLIGHDVEINWPGVGNGPTTPPAKSSLEAQLHDLGQKALFVDLTSPEIGAFIPPDKKYPVGNPSAAVLVPLQQFHGLFYLESSPGMDALYW